MNEHQLSLGETTTGGRRELVNRKGQLDYDGLMLADPPAGEDGPRGHRDRSTRSARSTATAAPGETFSIADKNEAWIMELIGKGPGVRRGSSGSRPGCPRG